MKPKKDKTLPSRMARYRESVRQVDVGRGTIDKLDRLGSESARDGAGPLSRRKVLEAVVEAAIQAKWVLTVDKETRPTSVGVREKGETELAAKDLDRISQAECADPTEAKSGATVGSPLIPTLSTPAFHVTSKSQSSQAMAETGKVDGRKMPEIPVFDPGQKEVSDQLKKGVTGNSFLARSRRLRIEAANPSQEAVEIWEEGYELCAKFDKFDSRKDTLYSAGFRRSKGGLVWRLMTEDKTLHSSWALTEAFLKGKTADLSLGESRTADSQPTRLGP